MGLKEKISKLTGSQINIEKIDRQKNKQTDESQIGKQKNRQKYIQTERKIDSQKN